MIVSRQAKKLVHNVLKSSEWSSRGSFIRPFSSSQSMRATWGFIGLGQMGYPMAKNLRAKIPETDSLTVFDINKTATAQFAKETSTSSPITGSAAGVIVAESVREVAQNSENIITMLPQPKHVKGVFDDIMAGNLEGRRLFIDCSTIDVKTSLEVGSAIRDLGHQFVDAPVSGGVVGATAGTLTFMLGAPDHIIGQVQPILGMMGKRVIHMGVPGMGIAGKLTNNYLLAINNLATAEAMNMGIKLGLDSKKLTSLINSATGKCWPSEVNNPVPGVVEGAPAGRDYQGGFGVSLMNKDLKLAMEAAELADARLILADAASKLYGAAELHDACKDKDFSVVYRYLQLADPKED